MTDTDRIAELESRLFSRRMAIGAHQREVDYIESELARLKEPEWEVSGLGNGYTLFQSPLGIQSVMNDIVTFIENRAVDRYKRDQADAVGALRAVLDGIPGSHDRARATLRAIDEGKRP